MADPHGALEGWLELRGLRCAGRHGAYPGEQDMDRPFVVDLRVAVDVDAAAESDDLADALDMTSLAAEVRGVVSKQPRALLERVAVDVARALLAAFPCIEEVRVRVAKPDPPGLDAVEEAVEISLPRRG